MSATSAAHRSTSGGSYRASCLPVKRHTLGAGSLGVVSDVQTRMVVLFVSGTACAVAQAASDTTKAAPRSALAAIAPAILVCGMCRGFRRSDECSGCAMRAHCYRPDRSADECTAAHEQST